MDLREITELLHALPIEDTDLLDYYVAKRQQLVREINEGLKAKGLQEMTLVELLAVAYNQAS